MGILPFEQRIENEQAVLFCMLNSKEACADSCQYLSPDFFSTPTHRAIFGACGRVLDRLAAKEIMDSLLVRAEMKKTGEYEWMDFEKIRECQATWVNYRHYVKLVYEANMDDNLRNAGEALAESDEENFDERVGRITDLSFGRKLTFAKTGLQLIDEKLKDTSNYAANVMARGIKTSFLQLNRMTGGLLSNQTTIIGGRPGAGKTTFALQLASQISFEQKLPCAFFSFEMPDSELQDKLACLLGGVQIGKFVSGRATEDDLAAYSNALGKIASAEQAKHGLHIRGTDGIRANIDNVMAEIRTLKRKKGVRALFVDYVQIMDVSKKSGSRNLDIGDISRDLKNIAAELNVPVIILAQLNREPERRSGDENKPPKLSDLRDSGALEQDASVVIFLWKETGAAYSGGQTKVTVAKSRVVGIVGDANIGYDIDAGRYIETKITGKGIYG